MLQSLILGLDPTLFHVLHEHLLVVGVKGLALAAAVADQTARVLDEVVLLILLLQVGSPDAELGDEMHDGLLNLKIIRVARQ